jgi:methionine-rich copper-binding protein CopC
MTTRQIVAALAALTILSTGSQAFAHPMFVSANPARSSVLRVTPTEIRVTFSEAVLPKDSSFQLIDAAGKAVRTGTLAGAGKNKETVVLPIAQRLQPGTYTVQWRAAAAGHSAVPGRYKFTVGP